MISGIKIKGIEQLKKKLNKLNSEMNAEIEAALTKGAEIIKDDTIERLKPYFYQTIETRKTIHIEKVMDHGEKIADVIVGVDPDYILYLPRGGTALKWIAFGKRGYAPYPFLRISYDANKGKVLDAIKNELKKTIGKAVK